VNGWDHIGESSPRQQLQQPVSLVKVVLGGLLHSRHQPAASAAAVFKLVAGPGSEGLPGVGTPAGRHREVHS